MQIKPQRHPGPRVPIGIHPEVRDRLARFLYRPEAMAVGYSDFISKALDGYEYALTVPEDRRAEGHKRHCDTQEGGSCDCGFDIWQDEQAENLTRLLGAMGIG